MATRTIDDTKLQNIAVAIQAKDNGGQMTVDEMPGRIALLPAAPVESPALILWDWEGTKLAEYDETAALALTALPAPGSFPCYAYADHAQMVFREWHWNLSDIKTWIQAHKGETLDVGAVYTTTDGQDHDYWGNPRLDGADTICAHKHGTATIEASAFMNKRALVKTNIPPGVTSIGTSAYQNCHSLVHLNVPNGVTAVSNGMMRYAYSLRKFCIPNTVTSIAFAALNTCTSIEEIVIPDSVTAIEGNAFYSCFALRKVIMSKNLRSIAGSAFNSCYSLTQLHLSRSLTSIGASCFANCTALCDILLEARAVLYNVNTFDGLPSNYRVYVPRADLSWFETATNWATIYTQGHVVTIEDNINYLESIGFNVDAYKGAA